MLLVDSAITNVGTTRVFRLREVIPTDEKEKRSARTYNIPLAHNSVSGLEIRQVGF